MTNTKGALAKIEQALDKISSFSTPNYERIDAAQEALALIKEMREEVPEDLAIHLSVAEVVRQQPDIPNFKRVTETAALVQKWMDDE